MVRISDTINGRTVFNILKKISTTKILLNMIFKTLDMLPLVDNTKPYKVLYDYI